jgi:hypothetical protein
MYKKLFDLVRQDDPRNSMLAYRTIAWLMCQVYPLPSKELIKGVCLDLDETDVISQQLSADYSGGVITTNSINTACHHLLTYNDATDHFEFGHFSVVEFMNSQGDLNWHNFGHTALAKICLRTLCLLMEKESESDSGSEKDNESPIFEVQTPPEQNNRDSDAASLFTLPFSEYSSIHAGENPFDDVNLVSLPYKDWSLEAYALFCWAWHCGLADMGELLYRKISSYFREQEGYAETVASMLGVESHLRAIEFGAGAKILHRWLSVIEIDTLKIEPFFISSAFDLDEVFESFLVRNTRYMSLKNTRYQEGWRIAIEFGSGKVLDLMLEKNLEYPDGATFFHHAAKNLGLAAIRICVPKLANLINSTDEMGFTPLILAVKGACQNLQHAVAIIAVLLSTKGVDGNASDMQGLTALHWAIVMMKALPSLHRLDVLECLLKDQKVSLYRRTADGETA